jgi:hypothetical protein
MGCVITECVKVERHLQSSKEERNTCCARDGSSRTGAARRVSSRNRCPPPSMALARIRVGLQQCTRGKQRHADHRKHRRACGGDVDADRRRRRHGGRLLRRAFRATASRYRKDSAAAVSVARAAGTRRGRRDTLAGGAQPLLAIDGSLVGARDRLSAAHDLGADLPAHVVGRARVIVVARLARLGALLALSCLRVAAVCVAVVGCCRPRVAQDLLGSAPTVAALKRAEIPCARIGACRTAGGTVWQRANEAVAGRRIAAVRRANVRCRRGPHVAKRACTALTSSFSLTLMWPSHPDGTQAHKLNQNCRFSAAFKECTAC